MSAQGSPHYTGQQIQNYRLGELLAQGGMGQIYGLVQSPGSKVIKLLHPHLLSDPVYAHRFLREGRILSQLPHPNIVALHDLGECPRLGPFMVLEQLEGKTLKAMTRERQEPFPPQQIIAWLQKICQALHFCHRKGIVHRDLKPGNIFIHQPHSREERVKLLDFGIAADPNEPDPPGLSVGTPRYMAPEQIRKQPISGKADLYALGVLLFELLTRRSLFAGGDSDALKRAHLEQKPPTLGQVRSDLDFPFALENLLKKLLAKEPQARPSSAAELYQQMTMILEHQPIQKKQGRLGVVVGGVGAQAAFEADAPTPPSSAQLPAVQVSKPAPEPKRTPVERIVQPPLAPSPPASSPSLPSIQPVSRFQGGSSPSYPAMNAAPQSSSQLPQARLPLGAASHSSPSYAALPQQSPLPPQSPLPHQSPLPPQGPLHPRGPLASGPSPRLSAPRDPLDGSHDAMLAWEEEPATGSSLSLIVLMALAVIGVLGAMYALFF